MSESSVPEPVQGVTLRMVLVETQHPGNIGSAARAMWAMGLDDLWLVRPRQFPDPQAQRMATEANALLEQAKVVDSLEQAVADCALVIAASRRSRQRFWPETDISSALRRGQTLGGGHTVAVVFGPEPSGLTTAQVRCSDVQAAIPTVEHGGSLNLAQAVQVFAWEWRRLNLGEQPQSGQHSEEWTGAEDRARLFSQLQNALETLLDDANEAQKVRWRLQAMSQRAGITRSEWRLISGLLRRS